MIACGEDIFENCFCALWGVGWVGSGG
jgi:hypothetical protein